MKELNLVELNIQEKKEIEGGILPFLILAGEAYLGICGASAVAGAAAGFIHNQYDKYIK